MTALLKAIDLRRDYRVHTGRGPFAAKAVLRAVDGVSFEIEAGRTLGLVGESGCGKSTTGKLALGLIAPTSGSVRYRGVAMPPAGSTPWRELRRKMQMVYQDPLGALDRRLPVGVQIMEPLVIHSTLLPNEHRERARTVMDAVGLLPHQFDRYPHELSGGQRQRVVLARALMTEPNLLVCDEPISALDVSIQAQVVNLLVELREQLGLTYLFISHDLSVVEYVSDDVAVMYLGRIVEQAPATRLYAEPLHPYTLALFSAVPSVEPDRRRRRIVLTGDVPSPARPPAGCRFHPRCPLAEQVCRQAEPPATVVDGHAVHCHVAAREVEQAGGDAVAAAARMAVLMAANGSAVATAT